jgi:hypothetical protein
LSFRMLHVVRYRPSQGAVVVNAESQASRWDIRIDAAVRTMAA